MRFAIPAPPTRQFRLGRRTKDWPLAYRLAFFILPSALLITLVAVWFGYRAASSSLAESLHNLPLFEAKLQTSTMSDTLKELRDSLFRIAQSPQRDARFIRENLNLFFLNNYDLIHEIGYKPLNGQGFFLLRDSRDSSDFSEYINGDLQQNHYSPFQQVDGRQLEPGKAKLFPSVIFTDPTSVVAEQSSRTAVMRMALLQPDNSGFFIIGIDLAALSKKLARLLQIDSPLRLPSQTDSSQLAFFFDADGWILFEMNQHQTPNRRYLPDTARQGYSGDLGRAGFDAAFRPWISHENYWRMVTDALLGRSGSVPAPADKYSGAQMGESGILCFAPVMFATSEGDEPYSIGGIAFFETTTLPLHAFLRVANYSITILVITLLLFIMITWRISRKLGTPLKNMAKDLTTMATTGELAFLDSPPAFAEQQKIQIAANSILSTAILHKKDIERLSQEMQHARSQLPVNLNQPLDPMVPEAELGLVGSSPLMREVREHVRKAAKAGTDVLLWGETGTGKELVAAAIHKAGQRSSGPYISINCGALDENLLLDALFGHVKGAFTEAKLDRKGAFLSADGGTLHLDEIANASAKVQQALLRALAVRRIRPLGSDKETAFDTRVVAATNVDLRECVRVGTFREDLYYRLAIISIETPPLRHRKDDIPELAVHCIREAAISLGRQEARLSRGALDMITAYDWPGNVREFKNCITRAMAFVEGDIILPEHITLEQDAYRTYSRSLPSSLLAGTPPTDIAGNIARAISPQPAPSLKRYADERKQDASEEDLSPEARKGIFNGIVRAASYFLPSGSKEGAASTPVSPLPSHRPEADLPFPIRHTPSDFISGNASRPGPTGSSFAGNTVSGPFPPAGMPRSSTPAHPPSAGEPSFLETGDNTSSLNDRQVRALALVRKQGEITRAQYEEVAGKEFSSRTAQNDLRELVEKGILLKVGAGPVTRYVLPEQ